MASYVLGGQGGKSQLKWSSLEYMLYHKDSYILGEIKDRFRVICHSVKRKHFILCAFLYFPSIINIFNFLKQK